MARISIMIVDGLEVLACHGKMGNARQIPQRKHHISQYVFYEFRMIVGFLCHVFLVSSLEQRIDGRRALLLDERGEILDVDALLTRVETHVHAAE